GDPRRVSRERVQCCPRGDAPEPDRMVITTAGQHPAARAEGDRGHPFRMPLEDAQNLTRCGIEQRDRLIGAPAGEHLAAGTPGERQRRLVTLEADGRAFGRCAAEEFRAAPDVPELDLSPFRFTPACAREFPVVRAESEGGYPVAMPLELKDRGAGGHIPDPDELIAARAGQPFAVVTEGHRHCEGRAGISFAGMNIDGPNLLTIRSVPEPDYGADTSTGQNSAVGAEGERIKFVLERQ